MCFASAGYYLIIGIAVMTGFNIGWDKWFEVIKRNIKKGTFGIVVGVK